MKKYLFCVIMFTAAVVSQAQVKQVNDPNAQERKVSGFRGIKVSDAIDLFLTQSDNEVVVVNASRDEYRDRIKTEVDNGILKIWYEDRPKWSRENRKLKAYISFKTLEQLNASGASDIRVTGTIKAGDLKINMSGASDFEGAIQANSMNIELHGASDMTVTGLASTLNIDVSGASEFKGFDFQTDNCSAKASGASGIRVTVNKELTAQASGASGVHYRGNGVIRDMKTSGASSVSKKS